MVDNSSNPSDVAASILTLTRFAKLIALLIRSYEDPGNIFRCIYPRYSCSNLSFLATSTMFSMETSTSPGIPELKNKPSTNLWL